MPPGTTTVEVTLEPDGEETKLRLRHGGLPKRNRAAHDKGWTAYLTALQALNANGD